MASGPGCDLGEVPDEADLGAPHQLARCPRAIAAMSPAIHSNAFTAISSCAAVFGAAT
jgi:hypothetical protein